MSEWIIRFISEWGYLGVFLTMVGENLFPPIPSELIMPFAGFAAQRGDLDLWGVIAAGTAGSMVGTMPWYILARMLGLHRFKALADRLGRPMTLTEDEIDAANRWFARYGRWGVLLGRLVPTVRTLISVPAGLAAMPMAVFLAFSAVGTLCWTAILVGAGWLLSDHYAEVEGFVDPVTKVVVAAIVLLYLYRFFTWKPARAV